MKSDRTALVTGANRGIGYEVARQIARKGYRVFLGVRRLEDGHKAAEAFEREGLSAEPLVMDVASVTSIGKAAQTLARQTDRLDVLVNNAGILLDEDTPILDLPAETFLQTIETNTLGPLLVTQAFYPLLKRSKQARVVNVSSGAGSLNDMGTYAPAYSISKAALNAVTRQLAGALVPIVVNSACPGWVRTDMGGANAPRSIEEGADTIVWLATEAPNSLTGQFIQDRQPIAW